MSININGNDTSIFGGKLPTPYIEKIEVSDDKINIMLSFYIEGVVGEEDSSLYLEYINSL